MPLSTHDWEWFILVYTTNCDNLGDGLLLFCPHDTIVMYYVLFLVVLYKWHLMIMTIAMKFNLFSGELWYTWYCRKWRGHPSMMRIYPPLKKTKTWGGVLFSHQWQGFWTYEIIFYNWLVVWNRNFMTFHSVGNVIIPSDELIFFRGVGQPPTR